MSDQIDLDSGTKRYLTDRLTNGRAILFTGAGFPTESKNLRGTNLPTSRQLSELLWDVSFPGDSFDSTSALGDIFAAAMRQHEGDAKRLIVDQLTVNPDAIPDWYANYFKVPWHRIYTLNIDDLPRKVQSKFHLQFSMSHVSGTTGAVPSPDELSCVYLNGMLADLPNVTFSEEQYGRRTAQFDAIYDGFVRDLMSHTVVFVGTQLDEPPLWKHLAMRGPRSSGRELRPKSFLVTPHLDRARSAVLESFNVIHIPLTGEEFAEQFLKEVAHESLSRPRLLSVFGDPFDDLSTALSERAVDSADFLLGREPSWADITQGFAIERDFEKEISQSARSDSRLILISGTGGSGKSTTLRRLALELVAEGKKICWLRPEAAESISQLRSIASRSEVDYFFIDRCERFGARSIDLISGLLTTRPQSHLVAAFAGGPFDEHHVEIALSEYAPVTFTIPMLDDKDIDLLIDALTRAARLGRLAGRTREEQVEEFRIRANRQLLVALLEATSGQRFEDKIGQECDNLAPDLVLPYATLALATNFHYELGVGDLLATMDELSGDGLLLIDRLIRQHLVLKINGQQLVARHPVIAREVVNHLQRCGQIAIPITNLAVLLASNHYSALPTTRERRLLTRLMNHEFLGQRIPHVSQVRELYADLEPFMDQDPHYFLQRGSYELERGDMALAENFLAQARGFADGDYMVETEWAYLTMKRACSEPTNIRAGDWFQEGTDLLLDVIDQYGDRSPNTFVILAQRSIEWVEVAPIDFDAKRRLLESTKRTIERGVRRHGGNQQFAAAKVALQDAYLDLARPQAHGK